MTTTTTTTTTTTITTTTTTITNDVYKTNFLRQRPGAPEVKEALGRFNF